MKNKKPRKKLSRAAIVLIGGLVAISVPLIIFLWIIISAYLKTGKPINGNRFANDLDPAIGKTEIKQLSDEISNLSNLDDSEIILKTATLRIYLDFNDNVTEKQVEEIVKQAYDKVNSKLPVNTYFKADDNKKMYDLEIHGYNFESSEGKDNFIYYILNKNSRMDAYKIQLVSKPLNPELVKELKGEKTEENKEKQETPVSENAQ